MSVHCVGWVSFRTNIRWRKGDYCHTLYAHKWGRLGSSLSALEAELHLQRVRKKIAF